MSLSPSLIRDVIRGIGARDARTPRRVPSWDLFVVLNALRKPPFEPLASLPLRLLTLKTVFFVCVSLALGRRSSEIHSISGLPHDIAKERVCLLVGCLTSQQHASVSQGRICTDNFTCCHTEIEAADQTFHLTQSQYIDTGPTSPSADPITPGAWQGSHWSANV